MSIDKVPNQVNFITQEYDIIKFWKENNFL